MKIFQDGNEISARFGSGGVLNGTVDGNKVVFDWYMLAGGTGEWTIDPVFNRLSGTWTSRAWGLSGPWTLRKIGEPIEVEHISVPVEDPSEKSLTDISGTYISSITSSDKYRFVTAEERSMRLEIRQEDDRIIAENQKFGIEIFGSWQGDKISFYMLPNKFSKYEIAGEWMPIPDTDRFEGDWEVNVNSPRQASGEWNLRKLD